jgi:AraC family transcriptional regulator
MLTTPSEETVARKFRLQEAPTLLAQRRAASPIAFTRLRGEGTFHGRTIAVPPEEAFAFQVPLAPMPAGEIWIDGIYSKLPAAAPGDTFVFNLTTNPIARLTPPYDFLRFYLSVATMDQLAYEAGTHRIGGLRTSSVGIQDSVMRGLALAILAVLQEPSTGSALFLDTIALAFHAHVVHNYGGAPVRGGSVRGGLAPWQLRRAHAFIDAHLDADPSISDLAAECRLSASHFARAFRQATGMSPHRWLMRRRIERAKELLLAGELGLAQIALVCGFVDQSHFTRAFAASEGQSPGKWRRFRYN